MGILKVAQQRLPGSWIAVAERFTERFQQHQATERLWDTGHLDWAVSEFVHDETALLIGPRDELLVVFDRPLRRDQFLVGAIAPPSVDGNLRLASAPDGIAVSRDPARAAATVSRRLLPRYHQALDNVRLPALAHALEGARAAEAAWDALSDSHCNADGIPLDEDAYGEGQARRDAHAWHHFEAFLFHGPAALTHAEANVDSLATSATVADRWRWQLSTLAGALEGGERIHDAWVADLPRLCDVHGVPHDQKAFADAETLRNAEARGHMHDFIVHGSVLHEIDRAGKAPAHNRAPARTTAALARSTSPARAHVRVPAAHASGATSVPPGPPQLRAAHR
jgi:hypothetical protein